MSSKPTIDLTDEKAMDYNCPNCGQLLDTHGAHIKQKLMLSMYCINDVCPIVRIKIFTIG